MSILLLLFQMNVLTTSTNEVGYYNQLENIINTLVPMRGLTYDDLTDLKAQIKSLNKIDQIIQQPVHDIVDLFQQQNLIQSYFYKNYNKAINVIDHQAVYNIYYSINKLNYEIHTKIFKLIQQIQNRVHSEHNLFYKSNPVISDISQQKELASNRATITIGQGNSAYMNDTNNVAFSSTDSAFLPFKPTTEEDNSNDQLYSKPGNESLQIKAENSNIIHRYSNHANISSPNQQVQYDNKACYNSESDKNGIVSLEESVESSNSDTSASFKSLNVWHGSMLYCLKRLCTNNGLDMEYTKEQMIYEYINGSRNLKKPTYEMAVNAVKKMCRNKKVFKKVGKKYKIVSEEAYQINVVDKISKYNEKHRAIVERGRKNGKIYKTKCDLLNYIVKLCKELKIKKEFTKDEMVRKVQRWEPLYSQEQIEIVVDKVIKLGKWLSLIIDSGNDYFYFDKEVKAHDIHPVLKQLDSEKLFNLMKKFKTFKKEFTKNAINNTVFHNIREINDSFMQERVDELLNNGKIKCVGKNRRDNNIYTIIDNN